MCYFICSFVVLPSLCPGRYKYICTYPMFGAEVFDLESTEVMVIGYHCMPLVHTGALQEENQSN